MKILIAMPLIDSIENTYKKFPETLHFIQNINKTGIQVEHRTRERQLIHFARNGFLETFVKGDFDYLMFLDDDNPPDQLDAIQILIDEMLKNDYDIASGVVPLHSKEKSINIFEKKFDNGKPRYVGMKELKKTKQVKAVGLGCSIISRKLAEFMLKTYRRPFENRSVQMFKTKDGQRHELSFQNLNKIKDVGEFTGDNIYEGGFSENILFCQRAKYHGFHIIATPKVTCKHIKYNDGKRVVLSL